MNISLPQFTIPTSLQAVDPYSDSRQHGYQGPTRNVRLARATPSGGGAIAKSQDGVRCAVTGKECLRIVRLSDSSHSHNPEHKSAVGRGGRRIDASRNLWEGSGLKIDSASTDVAWGHGAFNHKILTSARNGELIMWDLNKSGPTKYERRTKDHIRSIHKMSVSHVVQHYCITGSADGDMRVWDLRDMSKSLMRVHHPTSVRSVVFSPSLWQPLQAVVGLDNGSIYRWDLKMGQRGQLDRLSVAHTTSVTSLDWCNSPGNNSYIGSGGSGVSESVGSGLGWIASGGLDRCVKVWDLTSTSAMPQKPTYTLHPAFPVRRVLWRPSYECELAIVSNAEFATSAHADLLQSALSASLAMAPVQGVLSRVGSGLGLDVLTQGGGGADAMQRSGRETPGGPAAAADAKSVFSSSPSGSGDAVEIWDVRRGWIAKWSVSGSAVEGGVTDIAFGDPHALWTEHTSGMFSQIDLRNATKPLDAIPRSAATWEASGTLTFVTDRKARWEIPYDDIRPDLQTVVEERKLKVKAIGDPPSPPMSQNIGTLSSNESACEQEVFTKLARGYIFGGGDRETICRINAQVAFEAGKESAAQTWLLMGVSLTDFVPTPPLTLPRSPPPSTSINKAPSPPLSHSVSAPAVISSSYSFPSTITSRTIESAPSLMQKTSPNHKAPHPIDLKMPPQRSSSTSTPRKMTPTSSNSSSPRHAPVALPPLTPRQSSFMGRRESVDSGIARRSSIYRRPSVSTPSTHSASPSDRNVSLRHVGEGALDDSDSSGSGDQGEGGDTPGGVGGGGGGGSSDEDPGLMPLVSPGLAPLKTVPTPSPLSRVAGQHRWTEDEGEDGEDKDDDEASSPSPRSTDTESSGSSVPRHRLKSGRSSRRNSTRVKSRSGSSTLASLAAPSLHPPLTRGLVHQDSHGSIRTVTAGEASFYDHQEGNNSGGVKPEETIRDIRAAHNRQKSQPGSEFGVADQGGLGEEETGENPSPDVAKTTERQMDIVCLEEKRLRDLGWDALRQALERFADEGDMQMCAMLAVVAPQELQITKRRAARFLDSYIELLTRLRLYTCCAYLRKYCQLEDVRNTTLLETTIYTSCGKCRKPLIIPAGANISSKTLKSGYSYCLGCKSSCVICAICHLPVRALLFQCSVCAHGGHQVCYQQYYMQHPMIVLPNALIPLTNDTRGCTLARDNSLGSVTDDDDSSVISMHSNSDSLQEGSPACGPESAGLAGHPCAAGCGHYCWAANGNSG